ncbi:MAG: hypothetical protein DMG34_16860 [Acidobacteria bacterium]|nr:MAG: hypothetical protein DMG34_16860 [Acidobacteriota bacterium]
MRCELPLALVLFYTLASNASASAQDAAHDSRLDRLPVSVSLPVFLAWAKGTRHPAVNSGVTLSTQVSALMAVGITLRSWYGNAGNQQSCALDGDCFWEHETTALAMLIGAESYPLPNRLLSVRAAAGISWLREREAVGSVIHEARSWPLTVLTGVGWDLRVRQHLYATPLVELLHTARREPAPRTSPRWIVQVGAALTVR